MRVLQPFAFDEEERVVPRRYDERDGARWMAHGDGGVDLDAAQRETTRVAGLEPANRRLHAQALRAEDGMILAGARLVSGGHRAEAGGQLLAIDAAMTFERMLQVEEEEGPARVESVDVVVPGAVVEAGVHKTDPDAAALDLQVVVDREAHHAAVLRRHLTGGLHPPLRLPDR